MDTEEIFSIALKKFSTINLEARNEFRRLCKIYPPENEGRRLLRELGFLICELHNPAFSEDDKLAYGDLWNRFLLVFMEIIEYAKPYLKNDLILQNIFRIGANAKAISDQIKTYDLVLQRVRLISENNEKSKQKRWETLSQNIKYCPATHEVLYRDALCSKPRENSKERAIWRLLFECKSNPRHATFPQLSRETNNRGQRLFPKLGDEITSDLSKWNKPFKDKYRVTVLRKDGESIRLEEQVINNK